MRSRLEDKVAVVTGAGSPRGLGFAAARCMSRDGAKILLADLAQEGLGPGKTSELERRAEELRAVGAEAACCSLDLTNDDDIKACAAFAQETFGGIDILFNNAGVTLGAGPFLETPDEAWTLQYSVHVAGMAALCKAVIPSMRERGGGSIVNTSSNWATKVHRGASIYAATKLGTIGLTKAIAAEHGRDNIRCNAILPGPIRTDMQDRRVKREAARDKIGEEEARARIAAPLALGRVGEPEEVGEVVAFLASPLASFITGAAIPIDGGDMEGL